MKKKVLCLVFLSTITLLSCGGSSISSQESISSSSSSSEEVELPYYKGGIQGDLDILMGAVVDEKDTDITIHIEDLQVELFGDYPMEAFHSIIDYDYYQLANLYGQASMDSLTISMARGASEVDYKYRGVEIPFSSKEGVFYVDLTHVDLSDLSIHTGKYYFEDAYAFLNEETFATVRDVISMVSFDVNTILTAATDYPVIEDAITMTPADKRHYQMKLSLDSKVLSALSSYLSGADQSQIEESLNQNVRLMDGCDIHMTYDALTMEADDFGINLAIEPIMGEEFSFGSVLLKSMSFTLGVNLHWQGYDTFEMPDLEGYVPFSNDIPAQESGN